MAKRGLTPLAIAALKKRATRYEVPDRGCTGLYVVVQPSGRKSFALRYRRPDTGKPAKLTLRKGTMTLAEARVAATDALATLSKGTDPGKAQLGEAERAALAKADTLRAIAENYLKREGPKLRTADQRRRTLERLVFPVLGNKPIAEIKRSDIVKLLDKVEDDSGPRMASVTLAVLSRIFNWHASRTDDFRSPIVRGMARGKSTSESTRVRILSDDELRAVWRAAEGVNVFGGLVRFLLLTTARRNEAARMIRDELTGSDWCLPASRNKVKLDLIRPLSDAALAVLAGMPRINDSPFVFCSSSGRGPIGDFGRYKRALDAASGVTGWRLHDLRRTGRSLMSRGGVNPDHAERCLGHKLRGVRETYDRHEYHAEKKSALAALAAQVGIIINPPEGNVVRPSFKKKLAVEPGSPRQTPKIRRRAVERR
jgi:integrase